MNLQITVQEKLDALIENGAVDKIFETQLSKTIDKIIGDVFGEYSEFGKNLKEVLSKKLILNLDKINIDTYSAMVCNVVEGVLNQTSYEVSSVKIIKHIKGVLEILNKKDWKLSEIITRYRESIYSQNPIVIYEHVESDHGYHYINLGDNSNCESSRRKDFTYLLHLDKKRNIFAVSRKGVMLDPRGAMPDKFEVFLMQLWANESIIEIDEDESDYACQRGD